MATAAARPRGNAEDRRDQVVRAATMEFAEAGYHGASTAAIAKRAGISQPYIYALFPSKRDLFLAVCDRTTARIRDTFTRAASAGTTPQERLERMGEAYAGLIADRVDLLCQLQSYAASGDAEIRTVVARTFRRLFEEAIRVSGAPAATVIQFFACGMLINVTTALGLDDMCALALESGLPG